MVRQHWLASLLATALAVTAAPLEAPLIEDIHPSAEFPVVETTTVRVRGHRAAWPADAGTVEYLGIPYAAPPVDNLRFAAPQKWNKTEDKRSYGKQWSDVCMQAIDFDSAKDALQVDDRVTGYGTGMGGVADLKYSEDCLTLNIWASPTKSSDSEKKAVLIWIYGGAFGSGSTAAPFYNGARMAAEQDVVVVSINYRISVFGFPGIPGLSDLNLGLLDQRKGIEWLRGNIEKFGGDPKRMTLFGESAGGASVDYYTYAWTKDPIINGFIAQSGVARALPASKLDDTNWWKLADAVNCGGALAGMATIDCMRKLPAKTIVQGLSKIGGRVPGSALTAFGPVYDGKVVFNDYEARAAAGSFIKRPMLAGSTESELSLVVALGLGTLRGYIRQGGPYGIAASYATDIINSMRYATGLIGTVRDFAASMVSAGIGCPIADTVTARRKNGIAAWRYIWFGTWENQAIYPGVGAYHSIDCPIVFGATERNTKVGPNSEEQQKFIKQVMTAWATFAKDPDKGLTSLGWPEYDEDSNTLIRLGWQNSSALNIGSPAEYDKYCGVLKMLR